MTRTPSPRAVLDAFGLEAEPVPLEGGRGTAWRAGDAVLKPLDHAREELDWRAALLESIDSADFRLDVPWRLARGRRLDGQALPPGPALPDCGRPSRVCLQPHASLPRPTGRHGTPEEAPCLFRLRAETARR